jgi:circadian clock protein KaiC
MRHEAVLLPTGVPALDDLLGGGLPSRQVHLIAGHPGSGKTILAGQMAFAQACRGGTVLLVTASSKPHTRLLESLEGFDFFQRERIGQDINLLSIYPSLRKGVRETREMLLSSVRERKARMLVIDGLRALRDVWHDEPTVREFLAELGIGLASNDCTGVFTLECSPERIHEMPETATADSVMLLWWQRTGTARQRSVEVLKVRGRPHASGEHPLALDPQGFRAFRRVETLAPAGPRAPGAGLCALGIPEVDAAIGGGVPKGSVTLISGDEGAGKTRFARAFSLGEKDALFVSPNFSIGVPEGVNHWMPPPGEHSADEVAHRILERKVALGARRIVLDDAELLFEGLAPERSRGFWAAFLGVLRAGGADVLLTRGRGSPTPPAGLAENHFELRRIETSGRVETELQVIKTLVGGVVDSRVQMRGVGRQERGERSA